MMTRHVFLIGMPGCGKSSLGKKTASLLRVPYVDMDLRITDTFGMPVTDIFAQYGENAFRTAETNLMMWLSAERPSVISTGGGTVTRPENLRLMRNHGYIVLIDRPLEDIKSDIKLDRRPLLAAKGIEEVDRLYEQRIGIYRAAADVTLDNSHGYQAGISGLQHIMHRLFADI